MRVAYIGSLFACLMAIACGDNIRPREPDPGLDDGGEALSLRIREDGSLIRLGHKRQLKAIADMSQGLVKDVTTEVAWSSSSASVLSVSDGGEITALEVGTAKITATLGDKTASTMITVIDADLIGLEVSPAMLTSATGVSHQLTATGLFDDGVPRDMTTLVAWSSNNTAVATVTSGGLVTAVLPGSANITAALGGFSAVSKLTVTNAVLAAITVTSPGATLPAGATMQLTATGTYSDGTHHDLTEKATWAAAPTAFATVSATGLATGVAPGVALFSASYHGVTSLPLTLIVTNASISRIEILPAVMTLAGGFSQAASATAVYGDGTRIDVTDQAQWASTNAAVASVSATGLVTAHTAGIASISAAYGGATGNAAVTVTSTALTGIQIGAIPAIPLGGTGQLTATGMFADGTSHDITSQVQWSSNNTAVATVTNALGFAGQVTAHALGTAVISAQLGAISGSVPVTVTAAQLDAIVITPLLPVVPAGQTQQMTATGHYTDGTTANITSQVQWSSSATGIASVSSTGLVAAHVLGTAVITAELAGEHAHVALVVGPPILIGVSVSPLSITLPRGLVLPVVAVGLYSDGSQADITASLTWESSNPSVATVSNLVLSVGLVKAENVGTATISAQIGSFELEIPITVLPSILQSIDITAPINVLGLLEIQPFTAAGTYSDGTVLDITALVNWTTSDPLVAVVSNLLGQQGQVTALGYGDASILAILDGITGSEPLSVPCHVVINELSPGPLLANNDFVELYNPCSTAADLSGLRLVYQPAIGSTDILLAALAGTMPPNSYRVYAGPGYSSGGTISGTFTQDLPRLGGGVGLRVISSGARLDGVGWGLAVNGLVEGTVLGALSILGESFARTPNGRDTNSNLLDFALLSSRTPGLAN